jgi:hypothetical protein
MKVVNFYDRLFDLDDAKNVYQNKKNSTLRNGLINQIMNCNPKLKNV